MRPREPTTTPRPERLPAGPGQASPPAFTFPRLRAPYDGGHIAPPGPGLWCRSPALPPASQRRLSVTRRSTALAFVCALSVFFLQPLAAAQGKDIVDTAIAAGSFKSLVAAVQAAGLVDVLRRPGPYTVLAPTDEAFAKIPKADPDALLKDKAKLTAVLTYHVLTANVSAADLKMLKDFGTAHGGRITTDASKGLRINGANVVKADVPASNGVIHVIDAVLIPK
jgi:hypothetical protein